MTLPRQLLRTLGLEAGARVDVELVGRSLVLSPARQHGESAKLAEGYQAMAQDAQRETEALEWCNALAGDVADATR
ncbi:hypothetical protein VITFI_CDS3379 (plasmid) [Vitreoscilla filiformis]|uniref:SpoVT-AbrB domain-containing protein n=1 Tax=Vitreoscilla filiformis TaxID=63 RepID=A0A221KJH1_VITFI|nr:hypothetical protein VITFI_CDS3379 [Vitreoscilla filiformis]